MPDLRALQRAQNDLHYTTPLQADDDRYIVRRDGLGEQILSRILEPATRRLLLGGPAGCGKSTELIRLLAQAQPNYTAVLCPCDRDLDLFELDTVILVRYLLWRVLHVASERVKLNLTPEIRRDALHCLGVDDPQLPNPRMFFAGPRRKHVEIDESFLFDTMSRLLSEIERSFRPVLLLIDGLEKVRPQARRHVLGEFIRAPLLDGCYTVMVVPLWTLYGRESLELYPDVEVLRVAVEHEDDDINFVREIVARRAKSILTADALDAIASYSGGIPRDGLQLASGSCQAAMRDRVSPVQREHVEVARERLRRHFQAVLSDDPQGAERFLDEVHRTGSFPANPELRDLMIAHNIILPNADGSFRVHPAIG